MAVVSMTVAIPTAASWREIGRMIGNIDSIVTIYQEICDDEPG